MRQRVGAPKGVRGRVGGGSSHGGNTRLLVSQRTVKELKL